MPYAAASQTAHREKMARATLSAVIAAISTPEFFKVDESIGC
jgi:hypothetical protein